MLGVVRYVKKVKASKDELARLDSVAHISTKARRFDTFSKSSCTGAIAASSPLCY